MKRRKRERVAVIGGGASGLVSAWLLEDHHDVILFESSARIGGNWHTVEIDGKPADVAASGIFGSYHSTIRLAEILQVPLDPVGPVASAGLRLFLVQPAKMFCYGLGIAWLMPLWALYLAFRRMGKLDWLATTRWSRIPCPKFLRPYVEKWLVLSAVGLTFEAMRETPLLGPMAYSWANLSTPMVSPTYTPRGGFGRLAERLKQSLRNVEIRMEQKITRIARNEKGGWIVEANGQQTLADAVFLALPPWRAKEILDAPDTVFEEGMRESQGVDGPVVLHRKLPVPQSDKLLFFLAPTFVSYRLRTTELFRGMTPTGKVAEVPDPLFIHRYETDYFTGIAQLRALRSHNGQDALWMVHSAFHPSGSRNSQQAVELALEACNAFDSTLPKIEPFRGTTSIPLVSATAEGGD